MRTCITFPYWLFTYLCLWCIRVPHSTIYLTWDSQCLPTWAWPNDFVCLDIIDFLWCGCNLIDLLNLRSYIMVINVLMIKDALCWLSFIARSVTLQQPLLLLFVMLNHFYQCKCTWKRPIWYFYQENVIRSRKNWFNS